MEFKVDALLLKAAGYGENDKIVTLFTADRGKMTASMKGVRKAGAKLGFAAQPFCFAEYVCVTHGGRNTVISASLHDGFYALREDVNAYFAAASICEICDGVMYEGMVNADLLAAAVRALGELCEGGGDGALLAFLLRVCAEAGYPVAAEENCPVCGAPLLGRMAFDLENGSFTCTGCSDGVPASEITHTAILASAAGKRHAHGDGERRAVRLLRAYCVNKMQIELGALDEYLRLPIRET